MAQCTIMDLFPAFISFWDEAKTESPERQVELWLTDYLPGWSELLAKEQKNYADQGADWRNVAKYRIFPLLEGHIPLMRETRQGLLACVERVYARALKGLGLDFDILFVIYVGIGCGARWATSFQGAPACLFGLEKIAECGWTREETLAALTAHEVGHLLHRQWRGRRDLATGRGPFWQLYEEGFAQRCEHIIMGMDTWHERDDRNDWLVWCNENKGCFAAEFLRTVDQRKPANRFFGYWYDIRGRSQWGYFLGHEVVREWEGDLEFQEIALLPWDDVQLRARKSLEEMVGQSI